MEFLNLLAGNVAISLYGQTFDVALNWIGEIIKWIVGGVGVGVGVILFSVILKVIVLPFDVYQRIAMRKQNLKMKENQEKMEKLQKQYANNKDLYNQKVMEMYKESGFSVCSSCLPMILSMVIFFVAIGAFNAYSQYSNIENYNIMVDAYNTKMASYCADLETGNATLQENADGTKFVLVDEENKLIYYTVPYENAENADLKEYVQSYTGEKAYFIKDDARNKTEVKAFIDAKRAEHEAAQLELSAEQQTTFNEDGALKNYFVDQAQTAVLSAYETDVAGNMGFLWIKNIWATDASYKNPVLNYGDFKNEVSKEKFQVGDRQVDLTGIAAYTNAYQEYAYEEITEKLGDYKSAPNGFFILIVLSIGTILLQQFVSMRSQKEQNKYSSVDGQGASQQKMTLVIMTVMFAIFSFMYSAAFSIYMIMSNLLSLASTLIINKIVDVNESRKEEKAFREKYDKRFAVRAKGDDKKDK